jgi:choline dehydrogenase-like flavoprotein
MHIDARSIQRDEIITADLCIVGAGVAGIVLAREFIYGDVSVVLLESGGIRPDRQMQSLLWGENIGHEYYPLDNARSCGFGGSAHKWLIGLPENRLGARIHPLEEIDFLERSWVPNSGWPFDRTHLEPYYQKAQAVCRSGRYSYNAADWEEDTKPRLGLDPKKVETTIFHFIDRRTFLDHYLDQIVGCNAVRLLTHSTLLDLEAGSNLREVLGFRVGTPEGKTFRVVAKHYVLSLGAIECARTLLLSQKERAFGIGNQHDVVGRYFMEHPHVWSGKWVPASGFDLQKLGLYRIHSPNGTPIMGKLATTPDVQREAKLLNYCVSIHPVVSRYTQDITPVWRSDNWPLLKANEDRSNRAVESQVGRRGAPETLKCVLTKQLKRAGRLLFGGMLTRRRRGAVRFTLNHMAEQVPNPDSRVVLSDEKDFFGRNRVRLDWRLSEIDIRSIIASQEIIDAELRRIGAGRLEIDHDTKRVEAKIQGGWHHMGTTRMHRDPKKSVVDPNCRVHEMANLYIAGPSVFPTGGYANPVLTIVALAIRLADHLKAALKSADAK